MVELFAWKSEVIECDTASIRLLYHLVLVLLLLTNTIETSSYDKIYGYTP